MEHQKPQDPYAKYNSQSNLLSKIIFASRWLQLPISRACRSAKHLCLQIYEISMVFNRQYQRNGFQHYYACGIEFN